MFLVDPSSARLRTAQDLFLSHYLRKIGLSFIFLLDYASRTCSIPRQYFFVHILKTFRHFKSQKRARNPPRDVSQYGERVEARQASGDVSSPYELVFVKDTSATTCYGCKGRIHHFHIPHNTPCLPPQNLHNLCFPFPLGITVVPRETEDNAYAKFWGANKVYYGACGNGE